MASPPKAGIWLKRSSVAQCHLLWEGARVAICKGDCPWIAAGGCGAGMGALFCSLWGGLGWWWLGGLLHQPHSPHSLGSSACVAS